MITPALALQTAVQTFVLLWFVLLGLKAVGRRVFGELGPQDIILIVLLAESMDIGLTPQGAGFMGSIVSGIVLMGTMALVERIRPLRDWLDGTPVVIARDGRIIEAVMRKGHISMSDLEKVAREYGFASIDVFDVMVLEGDGSITGVLKPGYVTMRNSKEPFRPGAG